MEQTPRERRRDRTRRAILDAALELTSRSGPNDWTMRELAERIDFSTTATYRYFESKDAVLEALVDDVLAALRTALDEAVAGTPADASALDEVLAVSLAYVEFARANTTGFRLAFIDMPSRRTSLEQPPSPQSAYTVLLDAVVGAIDSGHLETADRWGAEQISFTIWSAIHGMAVLESTHLQAFRADIEAATEPALRRILAGLSHG